MKRIKIRVHSRLLIESEEAPDWILKTLARAFTHKNPQIAKLKQMGFFAKNEPEYIRTYETHQNGSMSFPRGGTRQIREILAENGFGWEFIDESVDGDFADIPTHRRTLYDYQNEAVEAAIARRNCIIRAPTGSGKTTMILAIAARLKRRTLIVVHQRGLVEQWIERITEELGIPKSHIGIIGGGKCKIGDITIGIQKSIYNKMLEKSALSTRLANTFGLVVGDELQLFAANTFMGSIEPFPARYRIGVSADETRADRKEFLIYDIFGTVASDILMDRVIEHGAIVPVSIRIIPSLFRCPAYRDATRPDFNVLLDSMTTNQDRNELLVKTILLALGEGSNAMVFSHRVEHCHQIDAACARAGIKSGLMIGTQAWAEVFDKTKSGLKDGSVQVGIGTIKAIGQGLDVPRVDCGVITTPLAGSNSKQQFGQVRGRICRSSSGKDSAVIYYVWDRFISRVRAIRNLAAWNRDTKILHNDVWLTVPEYVKATKSLIEYED